MFGFRTTQGNYCARVQIDPLLKTDKYLLHTRRTPSIAINGPLLDPKKQSGAMDLPKTVTGVRSGSVCGSALRDLANLAYNSLARLQLQSI